MDWFTRLTGFEELNYVETRRRLELRGDVLHCPNGRAYAAGTLELPSLAELRARVAEGDGPAGRPRVTNMRGNIRRIHGDPALAGALFQVASQFNMLEMVGPGVTPENGVAGYEHDHTQGPACAIAAGPATLYRNYFAPVPGPGGEAQTGQTAARQLDGLADLGAALARAVGLPEGQLWTMTNGYALATPGGLEAIGRHLVDLDEPARDALRGRLRIGLHSDVEVTDPGHPTPEGAATGHLISQVFCSALPVAYSGLPAAAWAPFAELVLEAAYEATVLAAVLNARRGASPTVLLTRLGGGAFGNADAWIDRAMWRAMDVVGGYGLDARIVSYGRPPDSMMGLEGAYGG